MQGGKRVSEQLYMLEMQTEIGVRKGKLLLKHINQKVDGWIELLSTREKIQGEWLDETSCIFQGNIYSIQKKIPYQATCSLCKDEIEIIFQIQNKKIYASGKEIDNE